MRLKTPNTITFSGEKLEIMKLEKNVPKEALDSLKLTAEEYMKTPVMATVYRRTKAPTGNPHDFSSLGPYWWPNPDTENGLPYVRRDGEVNPEFVEEHDIREVIKRFFYLSLAAYHFDCEEYGRKAEKFIYDWFLNPETYMTPNAEYAQAIPGICKGRGIGIIDFAGSYQIFDGIAILESLGYIKEETVLGMKKWYSDFVDWLLTSENGLTEDTEPNNHGTAYDVLLLSSAIFTGREALVKKICTTSYDRRFTPQVCPDGSQPWELARAAAMHYSLCNINQLMLIANMAERSGFGKYWESDEQRGVCIIKSALDYIYPFILEPDTFPYSEVWYDAVKEQVAPLLIWADCHLEGEGYLERAKKFMNDSCIWLARPFC